MVSALDAAKYLLTLDDQEAGDLSSNLKLQKLLYYAQGVHLAVYGQPLFSERIEAWEHGPVCPPVYGYFKKFAAGPIEPPAEFDPSVVPPEAKETLGEVHRVYGQFSAWRLREMTHEEPPWRQSYKDSVRGIVITHEALRDYFTTQLK